MALGQPEVPAGLGPAVLDAVLARHDEDAAGLLAALAALAAEPLAVRAKEGVRQLAADGVVSPLAAEVGRLALVDAALIEAEDAELLVALLARPGTEERQAAILGIEHDETGGALVECNLTAPLAVSEAHELLDGLDGADAPAPLDAQELTARVLAAARRTVELEIALGPAAAAAWPIVSRALTGDPAGLPRPQVDAAWEGDEDPELIVDVVEDEDGFQRVMEQLLRELEQHARAKYPPGSVVWEHGDFVASTMLEWKGGYDDGRLGHWTRAALAEYLLDYFPRKVSVDEDTLAAVPECVCAFLEFLDARGSLSGDPLEELAEACGELVDEFRERARDRSNWGLAKSMFMRMHAEGVDTDAPGAIDAWIADSTPDRVSSATP